MNEEPASPPTRSSTQSSARAAHSWASPLRALSSVSDEVTLPQLRTLVVVSLQGPQTVSALAERLDVHASTMTRMCSRLVARGLVVRTPSALDRREVVIELTATGPGPRRRGDGQASPRDRRGRSPHVPRRPRPRRRRARALLAARPTARPTAADDRRAARRPRSRPIPHGTRSDRPSATPTSSAIARSVSRSPLMHDRRDRARLPRLQAVADALLRADE